MDEAADEFSVGLSFGGVPTTVHVPLGAITAFADPEVRFGLQFHPLMLPEPEAAAPEEPETPAAALPAPQPEETAEKPQVVSLDAFRRRTPPKE